jgi:hypothetical protein
MAEIATRESAEKAVKEIFEEIEGDFKSAGGPPSLFFKAIVKSAKDRNGSVRNRAAEIYFKMTDRLSERQKIDLTTDKPILIISQPSNGGASGPKTGA